MIGGRKVRSNKGKKRGSYGPRTGKTRSGKRFRSIPVKTRKVGRKTRSNKGKKRTPYGPRTGKTRSGKRFRGGGKCVPEEGETVNSLSEKGIDCEGGPAPQPFTTKEQCINEDPLREWCDWSDLSS